MELANKDIVNAIQLVRVLGEAELPPASSIRMSRALNELEEQYQLIREERQDLTGKYQATNADEEPLFQVSEAQARNDRIQEIAEEKDIEPEEVDHTDIEVDVPEKATQDHEYATQQPYVPEKDQEALDKELETMFNDTVELPIQPIPADEIGAFKDAFYEVLESSDRVNLDRDEDAEGLRPGDIAPITFLFPADL